MPHACSLLAGGVLQAAPAVLCGRPRPWLCRQCECCCRGGSCCVQPDLCHLPRDPLLDLRWAPPCCFIALVPTAESISSDSLQSPHLAPAAVPTATTRQHPQLAFVCARWLPGCGLRLSCIWLPAQHGALVGRHVVHVPCLLDPASKLVSTMHAMLPSMLHLLTSTGGCCRGGSHHHHPRAAQWYVAAHLLKCICDWQLGGPVTGPGGACAPASSPAGTGQPALSIHQQPTSLISL